ncbi:hypothetical protein BD779DRAFT_1475056 [Infundibulicybe gibba]|nr:hypothetical protein BD779DRAFT_1475056 [Infundibulicybe gibba]
MSPFSSQSDQPVVAIDGYSPRVRSSPKDSAAVGAPLPQSKIACPSPELRVVAKFLPKLSLLYICLRLHLLRHLSSLSTTVTAKLNMIMTPIFDEFGQRVDRLLEVLGAHRTRFGVVCLVDEGFGAALVHKQPQPIRRGQEPVERRGRVGTPVLPSGMQSRHTCPARKQSKVGAGIGGTRISKGWVWGELVCPEDKGV